MSGLRSLVIVALLTVLACAACILTYSTFGNTWDEPAHLAAGLELLDKGEYKLDIGHPPLGRLAIALGPWLAGSHAIEEVDPSGESEGRHILYVGGHYDRTLTLARLGALPFLAILIVATWLCAKRWLGPAQGLLAVLFLATTPAILGHAAVAALDVPGTATCVLALYFLVRWLERPMLSTGVAAGLATGVAVGTKFYAIPYLAIALLVAVVLRLVMGPAPPAPERHAGAGRWLASVLSGLAAATLVLTLAYGGRFETLATPGNALPEAIAFIAGPTGLVHDALYALAGQVPMPIALETMALGIKGVEWHNTTGHLSFLLGEVRESGWWYFYPVVLAVKTPLPLLGLGLAGLPLLVRRGWRHRDWRIVMPAACFVGILGFCAFYSHINIGIRHVLILYPLLAMAAAQLAATAWQVAEGSGPIRAAVVGLLIWQALIPLSVHPDYLTYFNALAGGHPEAITVDSDLDWGQDLRRLEIAVRPLKVGMLWVAYKGNVDLTKEDLPPFRLLPPGTPVTGWIAISMLARVESRQGYSWLDAFQPVARIGKTIDLYYIAP